MAVTRLQHLLTDRDPDLALTAPAVIERLLRDVGKSQYAASEITELDLRKRRTARSFGEGSAKRLIKLISDEAVQEGYRLLFKRAEQVRKAQKLHDAPARPLDEITVRALLNEVGRGESQRTGGKADYWAIKLFWLQLSFGDDPRVVNQANLRALYDKYIAQVRNKRGEVEAFRNAIIIRNAYLVTCPFDTIEQRHALLGISYIAIDLAAQVNDYWTLRALADSLKDIEHEAFDSDIERALLNRLIFDAKSRANRYCPEFDYDYRVRNEAGSFAETAVEPAERVLKATGDLAFSWPELTAGWIGSYFGLLNYGINVGWPPEKLSEMFKRHDDLVVAIRSISPGATLLTDTVNATSTRDAYAAEFIATLAMSRRSPAHNLSATGSSYKAVFDPDKAQAIATRALATVDPNIHYGDTIVGALHLARAEALLCKSGRNIKGSLRDEYEVARSDAAWIFDRLGMRRKLLRLDRLELRAGIVDRHRL
jgi:hypothetical protein